MNVLYVSDEQNGVKATGAPPCVGYRHYTVTIIIISVTSRIRRLNREHQGKIKHTVAPLKM